MSSETRGGTLDSIQVIVSGVPTGRVAPAAGDVNRISAWMVPRDANSVEMYARRISTILGKQTSLDRLGARQHRERAVLRSAQREELTLIGLGRVGFCERAGRNGKSIPRFTFFSFS